MTINEAVEHRGVCLFASGAAAPSKPKRQGIQNIFAGKSSSSYAALPGFQGGYLSRRDVGDQVEFLVLTRWKSMDAIRGFSGPVAEHAVIDPGAIATLDVYDDAVRHYEVLEELL